MVIWTGRGWVGFAFMVGCLIGGVWLFDALLGDGYWEGHFWPKLLALGVCSTLCWATGRRLNEGLAPRVFDLQRGLPEAGAKLGAGAEGHTLAFVRLEYAGLVATPLYLFIAFEEAGFF